MIRHNLASCLQSFALAEINACCCRWSILYSTSVGVKVMLYLFLPHWMRLSPHLGRQMMDLRRCSWVEVSYRSFRMKCEYTIFIFQRCLRYDYSNYSYELQRVSCYYCWTHFSVLISSLQQVLAYYSLSQSFEFPDQMVWGFSSFSYPISASRLLLMRYSLDSMVSQSTIMRCIQSSESQQFLCIAANISPSSSCPSSIRTITGPISRPPC